MGQSYKNDSIIAGFCHLRLAYKRLGQFPYISLARKAKNEPLHAGIACSAYGGRRRRLTTKPTHFTYEERRSTKKPGKTSFPSRPHRVPLNYDFVLSDSNSEIEQRTYDVRTDRQQGIQVGVGHRPPSKQATQKDTDSRSRFRA